MSAPLALFEVIDPAVSPFWNLVSNGKDVSLHPSEMGDEFFCGDVQERRGDAFNRYRRMKDRLRGTRGPAEGTA